MDPYKGTCQEFAKVFTEDLASFEEADDKIQHHAEALTNCFKLVQSHPDSPSVQALWMSLIRSSVKALLWIDSKPSRKSLNLFMETIQPWLIDGKFRGLCCNELLDMYNLASKGPWSQPSLQNLLSGTGTSVEELVKVFDEGLECIQYHMASLIVAIKTEEFLLFAKAALSHPQVRKNKFVQNCYQGHVGDILNEEELVAQMNDFDFAVTASLLESSIKANRNCDNLCNAAVKYLLQHNELKYLEEILSCWIKLLVSKHSIQEVFDILRKKGIGSGSTGLSVQQCVVLARVLWKVVGEKGRMMCVEILCRALQLLSSDEQDSDELKTGILSSIAYFLPNSQVARSCILTLFILNPTVNHYLELAQTYKMPYERDKDPGLNFSANLRLSLLEDLQQQWPQAFLQSSSWDWPLLRTTCYKMLSSDDLNTVRLEEQEMEARELSSNFTTTDDSQDKSSMSDTTHSEEISAEPLCSSRDQVASSGCEASEPNMSGSGELCDCLVCEKKLQAQSEKKQTATAVDAVETKKPQASKPSASTKKKSGQKNKKEAIDEQFICPEESCQRPLKTRSGLSNHLSKTHRWTLNEIHGLYLSVEFPYLKPTSRVLSLTHKSTSTCKTTPDQNAKSSSSSPDQIRDETSPESYQSPSKDVQSPVPITSESQAVTKPDFDPVAKILNENPPSSLPIESTEVVAQTSLKPQKEILLTDPMQCDSPIKEQAFDSAIENTRDDVTFTRAEEAAGSKVIETLEPMPSSDPQHVAMRLPSILSSDTHPQPLQQSVPPAAGTEIQLPAMALQQPVTVMEVDVESAPTIVTHQSAMPSLPPIFNTKVQVPSEPSSEIVEEQPRESGLFIACPIDGCERVYKHRHTVREHLEFRHKISPDKAAKMTLTAEYIDESAPPPPPTAQNSQKHIKNSRGWYWPVDEFLGRENNGKSSNRSNLVVDSNIRFSLECDVIYTLGRAPLSYNSDKCAEHIIANWNFAQKFKQKEESQPNLNPVVEAPPKFGPKLKLTVTTVNVSHKMLKKPIPTAVKKANDSHLRFPVGAKASVKKIHKDASDSNLASPFMDNAAPKNPVNNSISSPASAFRSNSSQTNWKAGSKFSKSDHFHNLLETKQRKLKKYKKTENPIAITIIDGGSYVSRKSRTIASQCCQNEIGLAISASESSSKKPAAVKRKSASTEVLSPPLFSPNEESFNPPAPKLVKRKYDAQTVYHLADKYSDIRSDSVVSSAALLASSNSKPSFADALNSVNLPPKVVEKPKQKRKPSKSLEIINIDESPSFQKPRSSPAVSSRSNSSSSESSIKKPKLKKPKNREFLSSFSKKTSSQQVAKKRVDDLSRQLFPSHDYEELLKHAEELSSSVKSKPLKSTKTPSNSLPISQSRPVPISNSDKMKPMLRKSPVRDKSTSTANAQSKKKEVIVTSTPIPSDEESKKKPQKPTGKRRIDLRKLISSSKPDTVPATSREPGSSSFDDSFSSLASSSLDPFVEETQPSGKGADSLPKLSEEMPADEVENVEIVCPECAKPMSSAFALTCHMRRRHKVRSKKMFFPGQTLDTSHTSSSSSSSINKSTKKPSKNVIGPPEGTEACSFTASFGSARRILNASDSSDLDSESKPQSPCYSADVSALTSDASDTEIDTNRQGAISLNKHIKAKVVVSAIPNVSDAEARFGSEISGSVPLTRFIEAAVASSRAAIVMDPDAEEIKFDISEPIFDVAPSGAVNPNPTSEFFQQEPIASATSRTPASLTTQKCSGANNYRAASGEPNAVNSEISELVDRLIDSVESRIDETKPADKSRSRQSSCDSSPTSYIEQKDGFYFCALPNCYSRCKLKKSIRTHFRRKHYFEYLQLWGSRSTSLFKLAPKSPSEADKSPTKITVQETNQETNAHLEQSRESPVRRTAYTEASLQIQLSSINLSPRKWSQHHELMRLYSKRVRSKVAQALSPATRLARKSQLTSGKLFIKSRKRKASNSSSDSFEADYEAQLSCWGCNAMFHNRKNLTQHIQHHVKNIDLYEFRCDFAGCLYGFRTSELLLKHSLIHRVERSKPFSICLFCPNQSRTFPSFRKMVLHERVSHSIITIDMHRMRKTHCLNRVRNWGKPLDISDIESHSSERESFLAIGHRRAVVDNRLCCSKCAKKTGTHQPSVALPCKHVIKNNVESTLYDILETIIEYEHNCAMENTLETVDDQRNPKTGLQNVNLITTAVRDIPLVEDLPENDAVSVSQGNTTLNPLECARDKNIGTEMKPLNNSKSIDIAKGTDTDDTNSPSAELFNVLKQLREKDVIESTSNGYSLELDDDAPTRGPTPLLPTFEDAKSATKVDLRFTPPKTQKEVNKSPSAPSSNGVSTLQDENRLQASQLISLIPEERGSPSLASSQVSEQTCSSEHTLALSTDTSSDMCLILTSPAKDDLAKKEPASKLGNESGCRFSSVNGRTSPELNFDPDCSFSKSDQLSINSSHSPLKCKSLVGENQVFSPQTPPKTVGEKNSYPVAVQNSVQDIALEPSVSTPTQELEPSICQTPPRIDFSLHATPPRPDVFASPFRNFDPLFSPPRLSDIAGFDYDVANEVIQVAHKLVCDVEIEEQANYMRLCGFVPTGVMYYKQSDLLDSHGVGLSVYGYNSEAFVALDAAAGRPSGALPGSTTSNVTSLMTDNSALHQSLSSEQPCPSTDAMNEPACSSTKSRPTKNLSVENDSLPFGFPGIASDFDSSFSSHDAQSFQAKLMLMLVNREYHTTWMLDADDTHSSLCDISGFDPLSRLLFCQHYVVPSKTLSLLRPPLTGIRTAYPVTSDIPRYKAFTCGFSLDTSNDTIEVMNQEERTRQELLVAAEDETNRTLPLEILEPPQDDSPSLHDTDLTFNFPNESSGENTIDVERPSPDSNQLVDEERRVEIEYSDQKDFGSLGEEGRVEEVFENEENIDPTSGLVSEDLVQAESDDPALASTDQPSLDQNLGEKEFFDNFMSEIRMVSLKTSKKKKPTSKSKISFLPNAFRNRGRPRKSYDLVGTKGNLRRSMSEIVAFCDSTASDEPKTVPKPLKKHPKKLLVKNKKLLPLPAVNMNPVVSLDPLSVSSVQFAKENAKIQDQISFQPLQDAEKMQQDAVESLTPVNSFSETQQSSSVEIMISGSEKTSEKSAEDNSNIVESLNSSRVSFGTTDSEDNLPLCKLKSATDSVFLDHCYSITPDYHPTPPVVSCPDSHSVDVVISDYCEEIQIEQPSQMVKNSEDSSEEPTEQPKTAASESPTTSHSSEQSSPPPDVIAFNQLQTGAFTKEQIENVPSRASRPRPRAIAPISIKKGDASSSSSQQQVPCIFCTRWFMTVEDCKRHFELVHAEEVMAYKKEAKKILQSPRRHFASLKPFFSTSLKKRNPKTILPKGTKRGIRPLKKKPKACAERTMMNNSTVPKPVAISLPPLQPSPTDISLPLAEKIFPSPSTFSISDPTMTGNDVSRSHVLPGVQESSTGGNFILPTLSKPPSVFDQITSIVTSANSVVLEDPVGAKQDRNGEASFLTALPLNPTNISQMQVPLSQTPTKIIQPMQTNSSLPLVKKLFTKSCAIVAPTFRSTGAASPLSTPPSPASSVVVPHVTSPPLSAVARVPQITASPQFLLPASVAPSNVGTLPWANLPLSYRPTGATKGIIFCGNNPVSKASTLSVSSTVSMVPFISKQITKTTPAEAKNKLSPFTIKPLPLSVIEKKSGIRQVFKISPLPDLTPLGKSALATTTSCSKSAPNINQQTDGSIRSSTQSPISRSLDSLLSVKSSQGALKMSPESESLPPDYKIPRPIMTTSRQNIAAKKRRASSVYIDLEDWSQEEFPYEKSDFSVPKRKKLKDSFQRCHSVCQLCSNFFRTIYDFKVHMLLVHSLHLCAFDRCQTLCKSAVELEVHMRRDHRPAVSDSTRPKNRTGAEMTWHESDVDDDIIDLTDNTDDVSTSSEIERSSDSGTSSTDSCSELDEKALQLIDFSKRVWNEAVLSEKSKAIHKKLISEMETLPRRELLRYVCLEVKAYASRCKVHHFESDEETREFMHCPFASSCTVIGKRQNLYNHILKSHSLTKIMAWIQMREIRLKKVREKKKEDNEKKKEVASLKIANAEGRLTDFGRDALQRLLLHRRKISKRSVSSDLMNTGEKCSDCENLDSIQGNKAETSNAKLDGTSTPSASVTPKQTNSDNNIFENMRKNLSGNIDSVPASETHSPARKVTPDKRKAVTSNPEQSENSNAAVFEAIEMSSNSKSQEDCAQAAVLRHRIAVGFNQLSASLSKNSSPPEISVEVIDHCDNTSGSFENTTDAEDRRYKCRFSDCGKTIGGQSKFTCHMLTHSPSRVAWHKEEGKLYPLFNPVVMVARSDTPPRVAALQGDIRSAVLRREVTVVDESTSPSSSPAKQESLSALRRYSSPIGSRSTSSSPKSPLVVLKKLTSFS